MTAMMPAHYDPSNGGLSGIYDHSGAAAAMGHPGAAHAAAHPAVMPQKPKLFFKMPRVVHDQKTKFENDELFRRLARESEVRYTGYRDRPADERRQQFNKGLRSGLVEIAIVSNGTNINLTFSGNGNNFNNNNTTNDKEMDLIKEPGKVHIRSPFILNGVCVRWKGWLDLERLDGIGSLEYDEENAQAAQEEERIFREELERHRNKLREMDEKHRSTFRQPSSTSAVGTPTTNASAAAAAAAAAALHHHHHQLHHHHQYHGHSPSSEQNNIQVR